jgi:hypothetical protein
MAVMHDIPAAQLIRENFLASIRDDDMVYFLINVGDGDAQLVLLPAETGIEDRQAIIIDAARTKKIPWLVDDLVGGGMLPACPDPDEGEFPVPDGSIALVICTHPHRDHIVGMEELLFDYRHRISEYWDPGYYHPIASYLNTMREVERNPHLLYSQPASGYRRWIGDVALTVMSPSVQLKNRFDTYGVNINDASISIRLEFPASRVVGRNEARELLEDPTTMSLLLGADAQTLSWSYLLTEYPDLPTLHSAAAKAIDAATGGDLLRSDVVKISHHCSKRGVNLELMERIDPKVTLVSCVRGDGSYKFPHDVSQEIIREALDPVAKSGATHREDWQLGLFYTSDRDDAGQDLGSIALVISSTRIELWRFEDGSGDRLNFANARRLV